MVSKKKQNKSAEKAPPNDDIYLNDLQVEIKQEEELIIEDADQQHVEWRFFGMDDDFDEEDGIEWECEEFQLAFNQNGLDVGNHNNQFHNMSFDEVIEISDEDNDAYEEVASGDLDTSYELLITNEPLQDSIVETHKLNSKTVSVVELNKADGECEKDNKAEEFDTSKCIKANDTDIKADIKTEKMSSGPDKKYKICIDNDRLDYLNVGILREYMCRKLMKLGCHICGAEFRNNIYKYMSHMKNQHPKFFSDIPSKYKPHSDNSVICKLCKMQVTPRVNQALHYTTRHLKPTPPIFLCTFCDKTSCSFSMLQNHQNDKHPSVITRREVCPKCKESFKDYPSLEFHFMSTHVRAFNSKYVYKCHLCDGIQFDNSKNKFFAHLMEMHKLTSWKVLNFRKIDNGLLFSCSKCFKIFTKANVSCLLGHYLTHEDKSTWHCKHCKATNKFKDWPTPHLCHAMRKFYEERNQSSEQLTVCRELQMERTVSWNEFEGYIEHVCPFCNEFFNKFEDWRLHLRELHHIHTLEGLNMTILPEDNNKLLCLECNERVTKSAIELHKHRFQHLQHEPYKCRHCAKCLSTYKKALYHVQKECQDIEEKCIALLDAESLGTNTKRAKSAPQEEIASAIAILCPLCNNKRFWNLSQISKHIESVHENFDKQFTKSAKTNSRSCKICQQDVRRSNNTKELIAHYFQHLHEKPFKCQKCLRSYPTYRAAARHVASFHLENSNIDEPAHNCSSVKEETEANSEKEQITSPPKKPKQKINSLERPKTSVHITATIHSSAVAVPKKEESVVDNNFSLPLKISNGIGLNIMDFNQTVFKTFEPYITYACPECGELFSKVNQWQTHVHSKHTFFIDSDLHIVGVSKRKGKCIDCHALLPLSKSKQLNHKLIHMPYRSFICALCSTHISAIGSMYKHLRKSHFCEGTFKCNLCSKALSTDFERIQHLKKAHPSKKWPSNICTICLKIFDDMDAHLTTHHVSHQRTYRCKDCGIYFEYTKDLETHVQKMHTQVNKNEIKEEYSKTTSRLGKRKSHSLSSPGISNKAKKICSSTSLHNA